MTDWGSLQDAYGSADQTRALLERADSDDRAIWDELWSRLCHQGTVYSASYAALPRLTELAERRPPAGYVEPLALAAAILASLDGPEDPRSIRARYSDETSTLSMMAERNLELADGSIDFIYALQTLLATEETTVWATRLDALADQELELACPQCDESLLMRLERSTAEVTRFSGGSSGTAVLVANPSDLDGPEARAYLLTLALGHRTLTDGLLKLFGRFACPNCGFRGAVSQAIA